MMQNRNLSGRNDLDPQETSDWLDSLDSVIANEGYERAHFLAEALFDKAPAPAAKRRSRRIRPTSTPSRPTLRPRAPVTMRSSTNCAAIALERRDDGAARRQEGSPELGGHISSFASAATL